ncbi:MAG TPA: hypothetical protein VH370_06245 [Humisphaera sp.]|jgi:hypothetical protein|nr:hypothetical protein [Humisphaera sp.]
MTLSPQVARLRVQSPLVLVVVVLLSIVVAIASYAASGATLGLFFGPILLAPIVLPPLALSVSNQRARFAVCIIYAGASAVIWFLAGHVEAAIVVRCIIVLLAFALALAYIPAALIRIRFHPVIAAATATILGFAWLTWPVWLARALPAPGGERMLRWAGPANPIFAVNGALRAYFMDWDRFLFAYQQLTTLNQDVLYSLPRSIMPSAITHLLIALGCCMLAVCSRTKMPAKAPQD